MLYGVYPAGVLKVDSLQKPCTATTDKLLTSYIQITYKWTTGIVLYFCHCPSIARVDQMGRPKIYRCAGFKLGKPWLQNYHFALGSASHVGAMNMKSPRPGH